MGGILTRLRRSGLAARWYGNATAGSSQKTPSNPQAGRMESGAIVLEPEAPAIILGQVGVPGLLEDFFQNEVQVLGELRCLQIGDLVFCVCVVAVEGEISEEPVYSRRPGQ